MRFKRLTYVELFLLQVCVYALLWVWDDLIATLLTLSFATICLFILIISLISDRLEKSNVPRWYYEYMIVSILAPIITAIIFVQLLGNQFDWMQAF